jgi:hypothetical protein
MRVALGVVIGAIIVLMSFTLVVHGLGMAASSGTSDNFYSANDGLNEFKMKMAQIMDSSNQEKENSANVENQGTASGLKASLPGVNSSDVNLSADNLSAHDLSTVNPIPFKSPAHNAGAVNSSELNLSEFNSSAEQSQLASPQNSSLNSSFVNQSLENRTSGVGPGNNSTSRTGSDSRGSMLSQSDSISPSGIHSDNQASFNGDWSMQANKQGFGNGYWSGHRPNGFYLGGPWSEYGDQL